MKTWTNPTVVELEVKMTASGILNVDLEQIFDRDYPLLNDPNKDEVKDEETYPS